MNQEILNIRLTNWCNNQCLYCLEKSLKYFWKWVKLDFKKLSGKTVSIYGGNLFANNWWQAVLQELVKTNINISSIQTNWYGLDDKGIEFLQDIWVKTVNFKFHSLKTEKDYILAWKPLKFLSTKDKLKLVLRLLKKWFKVRVNYFVTKYNLLDLYQDFTFLYKLGIKDFDFIWPHPFDKVWDFKDIVLIDYKDKENKKIFNNFLVKLSSFLDKDKKLNVNFIKFPCSFFDKVNNKFCNLKSTVLNQISQEDKEIFDWKVNSYCYPKRCNYCFLQDICPILNGKNI